MSQARRKALAVFDVVFIGAAVIAILLLVMRPARSVEPPQMQIGRMK